MDLARLIGTVRTTYEVHSFHLGRDGDRWLVVRASESLGEARTSAEALLKQGEVDGVRIVRKNDHVDHEFRSTVVVAKVLRAGVQETDPLLLASPGRDASWCEKPEDVHGDCQRLVFRQFFAKYLDERRLTPLEVIHHEGHAKTLDQSGTVVQGALQRIASHQVRGTKQSAVARVKELMALEEEGLRRLIEHGKAAPPAKIAPRQFGSVAADLTRNGVDFWPQLYRALAFYLSDAKGWVEKLDRLFLLWEPDLGLAEVRALDSLAAEILASPLALKELAPQGGSRLDLVKRAVDLYAGNLGQGADSPLPAGVRALSRLLAAGVLPRSLTELRLGLLRHLYARAPFRSDNAGIREEVQAAVEILDYCRMKAPALARDEEVTDALATKIDRLIQPEAMADLLAKGRSIRSKIDLVLGLIEQSPGDAPKAKLAPYLRTLIQPEELVRDSGAAASRAEAIKPMAKVARRIQESGLPAEPKHEMVAMLDAALFELLRTDLLSSQMPFTDRMLQVIRLCGGLPEGKTRNLASDMLSQALKRPEFILHYLERFDSAAAKRDAYVKLCQDILATGLVDKALVPMAA